eukprot:239098-Rhodomonas_salina.1
MQKTAVAVQIVLGVGAFAIDFAGECWGRCREREREREEKEERERGREREVRERKGGQIERKGEGRREREREKERERKRERGIYNCFYLAHRRLLMTVSPYAISVTDFA